MMLLLIMLNHLLLFSSLADIAAAKTLWCTHKLWALLAWKYLYDYQNNNYNNNHNNDYNDNCGAPTSCGPCLPGTFQ